MLNPVILDIKDTYALITTQAPNPAIVVLKAVLDDSTIIDYSVIDLTSATEAYFPLPPLWKSAIITFTTFPVSLEVLAKAQKLRTGEHSSPPSGYPTKRSLYAIPETYGYPIDTRKRVKSALSYFGKHKYKNPQEKKRAAVRILRAAKRLHVQVNEESHVYKTAHGK